MRNGDELVAEEGTGKEKRRDGKREQRAGRGCKDGRKRRWKGQKHRKEASEKRHERYGRITVRRRGNRETKRAGRHADKKRKIREKKLVQN